MGRDVLQDVGCISIMGLVSWVLRWWKVLEEFSGLCLGLRPWSWAAAYIVEWVCGEVLVMSVVVLGGRRVACICVGEVVSWMDDDGREVKVQEDMVLTMCV